MPQQNAVEHPFFLDQGFVTARKSSGTPMQKRLSAVKLRKFSETPVVRRLISYYRSQITRLDYTLVPKDGKKLTKAQEKQREALLNVLRTPNPDDSWRSWLGQLIEDMLVIGWGVSEIKKLRIGEQQHALYPVDGASIQVYTDWDGTPSRARYAQWDHKGTVVEFKNSDLMVMKHNPRTNTPFGLGPVEVAAMEIDYLLNAQAFAGRTAHSANPKKLLWLKGMSTEQINTIRGWWKQDVEGSGSIPILGGDGDASTQELGLVTDQNLFLKWQEMLIAIIADAFDADVQKVNLIVGINRSTGETLDDVTDESAIRPLAASVEQYINQYLLPLYGLGDTCEFRFQWVTSNSDRRKLSTVHQIYAQMDALTIDEIRAEMGKAPLTHPKTKEPLGGYTLTAYRAMWKSPAAAVDGPEATVEEQKVQQQMLMDAKTNPDATGDQAGASGRDKDTDPNGGAANGVYGAKNGAKDKPLNRADEREAE